MNRLVIFVLSFGRKKVPTLANIADKSSVYVLTSDDNPFKNEIELQGARLMVFDKEVFRGEGLEMMNEESVPNKRSATYGYNYAIRWGRSNGYKYVLVLDDDYVMTMAVNERTGHHPKIDKWAKHACTFLDKHPEVAATASINLGQLFSGSFNSYFLGLKKWQLMNTIVFNTDYKHEFRSLGNADYVTSLQHNCASPNLVVRLQTILLQMETINQKKHATADYSNIFYARWSVVMAQPAYARVEILKIKGCMSTRFNTVILSNSCPKIVSL